MEITRRYVIERENDAYQTNPITIIDINNAAVVQIMRHIASNTKLLAHDMNDEIEKLAKAELSGAIITVLRDNKNVGSCISLNLYDNYPSLWFWNNCLHKILRDYPKTTTDRCNFVVTFQTDVDRQYYFDNSTTLAQFQKDITADPLSATPDDVVEYQTKLALLHFYNAYNMNDNEMESIITQCSSLEEVLRVVGEDV